jgi:hypothetical protein
MAQSSFGVEELDPAPTITTLSTVAIFHLKKRNRSDDGEEKEMQS